jgi:hypothetical protein
MTAEDLVLRKKLFTKSPKPLQYKLGKGKH